MAAAGPRHLVLALLAAAASLLLPGTAVRTGLDYYIGNVTYPIDDQLEYCDTLTELYDGITADLRHWKDTGISREAVDLATARYTTRGGQKGVTLAFYGGTPYIIDEPKLHGLGHHCNILFTYMLVMMDLARQYGKLIPDLEFVLASSDRPLVLTQAQQPGLIPPVMRFCSSKEHADIQIPVGRAPGQCRLLCRGRRTAQGWAGEWSCGTWHPAVRQQLSTLRAAEPLGWGCWRASAMQATPWPRTPFLGIPKVTSLGVGEGSVTTAGSPGTLGGTGWVCPRPSAGRWHGQSRTCSQFWRTSHPSNCSTNH